MNEIWKSHEKYPGYEISNTGKVRSYWEKVKKKDSWGGTERVLTNVTHELSQSDDGNGYLKVYMRDFDGKNHCVKVHRLVAETFIPNDDPSKDTVDHIISGESGKLNNSVDNLRWISRRDNIQKAYRDGMCNRRIERQKREIYLTDLYTGDEKYFNSIGEAAGYIGVHYTTLSHSLSDGTIVKKRYVVENTGREEILLYDSKFEETY